MQKRMRRISIVHGMEREWEVNMKAKNLVENRW